ncbi:MAG: aspartate--tRNA(Asn) ligase [Candidatus Diapherotrites archaeon]
MPKGKIAEEKGVLDMAEKRISTKEVTPKLHGKKVLVGGWVNDVRAFGKLAFVKLRDAQGKVQITAHSAKVDKKVFDALSSLSKESVVFVTGTVQKSDQAEGGAEIIPARVEVISAAHAPVPLDISGKIESDLSARLDWRSIDLRQPKNAAVFRVQAKLLQGAQEYLNSKGFLQVFTPCIMGTASESGAEVFEIGYFGKKAYLRQDPQLHRQLTIAGGVEKLYDIGPSWRAEQSHTVKHLCEHRAIAVEWAFIKDEVEAEIVQAELVEAMLGKVKKDCAAELELFGIDLKVPKAPFPEVRFPELYDILAKEGKKLAKGEDLDSEAEGILWEYVKKKYKTEFYFVNRFPFAKKPFYVMRVDEDKDYARSIDLYYRGLELSSGGQREHRYDKLMGVLKEKGVGEKSVEWFTKFFKYGVPPHGGFAIGIERITQQLLGLDNIREAVLFTRDTERVEP